MASAGSRRREIALTFDDGPGPYTPRLLELLRETDTPATFFRVGRGVRDFPAAAVEEVRDGHAVGNHTEDHVRMGLLAPRLERQEIAAEAAREEALGLAASPLFRPP